MILLLVLFFSESYLQPEFSSVLSISIQNIPTTTENAKKVGLAFFIVEFVFGYIIINIFGDKRVLIATGCTRRFEDLGGKLQGWQCVQHVQVLSPWVLQYYQDQRLHHQVRGK